MAQFPILPDPEGLRNAAAQVEEAQASEAARLTAEAAANAAKAAAATKLTNAESALNAVGINSGGQPPVPPNRSIFGSFGFGGDKNVVYFLVGLAILLLFIFTFVLATTKANHSSVSDVQKTASGAATAAASANAGVAALATQVNANTGAINSLNNSLVSMGQSVVTIGGTANKALAEAEAAKALAASKSACCSQQKHVSAKPVARREASRPAAGGATPFAQAPTPTTQMVPQLEITSRQPRTDGRCVLALNDNGPTKYVRLDVEKGSSRLLAFRVDNSDGEINKALPITYVGYINGNEKKTVELNGTPSCAAAVKAFSEDIVFRWTASRLQLGDKCKVVGRA